MVFMVALFGCLLVWGAVRLWQANRTIDGIFDVFDLEDEEL